eukprot:CAMPEP_0182866520 /NCGR_PEP_ID=MMETSP0034_2-20130328/8247_1 /TAXON_ID=156128 /ORGANISM="Nephroselmis pyriformis, Strain CCMP717" /LENGTH=95 /DNA_ID=CAMNT_0024998849 /DNA_START=658 /DNA_END=942 /DNA_ORIENTATION=+
MAQPCGEAHSLVAGHAAVVRVGVACRAARVARGGGAVGHGEGGRGEGNNRLKTPGLVADSARIAQGLLAGGASAPLRGLVGAAVHAAARVRRRRR